MTRKTHHILEVLKEIQTKWVGDSTRDVKRIRDEATQSVASREQVKSETVRSAYVRQLGLRKPEDFDRLVSDWLHGHSNELQHVLARQATQMGDREAITAFFAGSARELTIVDALSALRASLSDTVVKLDTLIARLRSHR